MQLDKNHFRSILFIGAITPMALLAQSHDDHSGHGGGHARLHAHCDRREIGLIKPSALSRQ